MIFSKRVRGAFSKDQGGIFSWSRYLFFHDLGELFLDQNQSFFIDHTLLIMTLFMVAVAFLPPFLFFHELFLLFRDRTTTLSVKIKIKIKISPALIYLFHAPIF